MRKLLLLLPVAAAGLFLTGCDESTYRERTVVYDRGPAYYGGTYADDGDDFYYVSSRPYSRVYGQLYLRDGGYYYNRGGSYYVYRQSGGYAGGYGHQRYYGSTRGSNYQTYDRDHHRDHNYSTSNRVVYQQNAQGSGGHHGQGQWQSQKKQATYAPGVRQQPAQQAVYQAPPPGKKKKKEDKKHD